jgi:hypothetical protein
MYEHLLSSGYQLFLKNIKSCLSQQDGSWEGEKNKDGSRIFAYGSFPPIKIQVPEALHWPQPIAQSRGNYQASLPQLLADARQLGDEIAKGDTGYKTNQPWACLWLPSGFKCLICISGITCGKRRN